MSQMSHPVAAWLATADGSFAATSAMGKWVFVAALAALLAWLVLMPKRLIGRTGRAGPWWRNVRFWAIVVTLIQIWVYAYFG